MRADPLTESAPLGQCSAQSPQAAHASALTNGFVSLCCSSFPLREEQPMPRFFSVAPNPDSRWPVAC